MYPQLLIKTFYSQDDPKFRGDYTGVELWVDGILTASWSDYYHEKGHLMAEATAAGVQLGLRIAGFPGQPPIGHVNETDPDL